MALSVTPLPAPQVADLKRLPYSFIDWLRMLRNMINATVTVLLGFNSNSQFGTTGGTFILEESQYIARILQINGVLTSNVILVLPDTLIKDFIVFNNTTGAFTVRVKTPSSVGIVVGSGKHAILYVYIGETRRVTADT